MRAEYRKVAEAHERSEADKVRVPLAKARANAMKIDWSAYRPTTPSYLGPRAFEWNDLAELARYIDWTPFFQTWELKGRYPAILDDPGAGGGGARSVRRRAGDAEAHHRRAMVRAQGGDRLLAGGADWRRHSALRRRAALRADRDFLHASPAALPPRRAAQCRARRFRRPSRPRDYVGAFVVTAGLDEDAIAKRFEHANDDYSSIMVKALADRFAEALAEAMHARVRRELWGYAPDETFTPDELITEPYHGIRPAPGYPAQPDHTEKATLFRLLDAERATGVTLTESYAMWPGSSVSGVYIAHPDAHYFGVAKVERDQVEDYAARKGMDVAEVERWLGPVLNYVPGVGRRGGVRARPARRPVGRTHRHRRADTQRISPEEEHIGSGRYWWRNPFARRDFLDCHAGGQFLDKSQVAHGRFALRGAPPLPELWRRFICIPGHGLFLYEILNIINCTVCFWQVFSDFSDKVAAAQVRRDSCAG